MHRWLGQRAPLVVASVVFLVILLKHLSHPLLWQDEAETAVYATRILEYGYPKVHGERNVVYEFGTSLALGIDERLDAYIGTTWGHFYYAVPGVIWARTVDDLYAKTARIRLPFAIAGALGTGLFVWAVLPLYPSNSKRRRRFATCFFLLSAGSISLVLHLREARYYPLLVAVIGAILCLHLRHSVFETLDFRRYAIALCALLVLLFNVFFSAYFIVVALLLIETLWRLTRRPPAAKDRVRSVVTALSPLLLSAVCVLPLVLYFETFRIAAEFSEQLGITLAGYGENLTELLWHLTRHELLIAAVGCRLAVVGVERRWGPIPADSKRRRVAQLLVAFALGYALITCLNPLVYERYFVVLSPVLTLIFLLDGFALVERLRLRAPAGSRRPLVAAVAIAAFALLSAPARIDDLSGRLLEIAQPYRGPLDFAIPWLAERYSNPENLVIATNYENHPYMYYLGSHVIVGLSRSNIRADRGMDPDVVIPRRRWSSSLGEVQRFLATGRYQPTALEVRDLHYNNVPALSRSRSIPDPHRFETARPAVTGGRLEIYTRSGPLDDEAKP